MSCHSFFFGSQFPIGRVIAIGFSLLSVGFVPDKRRYTLELPMQTILFGAEDAVGTPEAIGDFDYEFFLKPADRLEFFDK